MLRYLLTFLALFVGAVSPGPLSNGSVSKGSVFKGSVSEGTVPGDKLRVVTTLPDLADIAREIGGDRIGDLASLAKGTMNIHAVPLRPSSLIKVNKADLFLQIGLSLEHAYVPGLLAGSRNERIQPGAPGFVNCSVGWKALNVPTELSRAMTADVHPQGNPHMNLDPRGGRHMAQRVLEGFLAVDPESKAYYEGRHAAYVKRLGVAETRWAEVGKVLAGNKIVTYHNDFTYLVKALGMEVVATVEPKAGVPPTPSDLVKVVGIMKKEGVELIVVAKWANGKAVRFVADRTGARILEAPAMVGGVPEAKTWIEMMDFLYDQLVAHLAPR